MKTKTFPPAENTCGSGGECVSFAPIDHEVIPLPVLGWWNGRHACLRGMWGNPWGFESPPEHHFRVGPGLLCGERPAPKQIGSEASPGLAPPFPIR